MPEMGLPHYAGTRERVTRFALIAGVTLVLAFLVAPLFIVVPLSFNNDPFFSFPIHTYSLRWFRDFFSNTRWIAALENSVVTAVFTTVIASTLGTMAALGLARPNFPCRRAVMALLISPMIVPIVIVAVGDYLLFGFFGLTNTRTGLVLAHTALAAPFVVITVSATLSTYDPVLTRAARSLGASPLAAFRRVTLPVILPGVVAGAVFAFATSFDEVVVALFMTSAEQRTLPVQMFSGIRDQINPTIMAAATLLLALSTALFVTVAWLSARARRVKT
ncbi:ABC transporter permease [Methylobacterium ajmalii]|jgi:putative spermidine/putrescine transport system permease protein|uniref:ABC transporter permease n=2 Tax=Methylobacterium TaxID=407 RepID=UPI001F2F879C|nr:ABC transporter permease [Methylobacterium ajmalii]MBZ6415727.1 ABC transporter permease [Methylobacterium sp.]